MTDPSLHITVAKSFARNITCRGPGECWPWRAGRTAFGYGVTSIKRGGVQRPVGAHRVAHYVATGVWEDRAAGRIVRHLCHNPLCCNPSHLRGGTLLENSADRHARTMGWPLRHQSGELVWPFDLPPHKRPNQYPEPDQ